MDNKISFPKQFLFLANYLATNIKVLNPGEYKSNDGKYRITLLQDILGYDDKSSNEYVRVIAPPQDLEIQASKRVCEQEPAGFIFFLMLWCYWRHEQPEDNGPETDGIADLQAADYCLAAGKCGKDILVGFEHMCQTVAKKTISQGSIDNVNNRFTRLSTFIKDYSINKY